MLLCDGLQGVTASGYAKSLPMLQLLLQARHAKPVACVSTKVIDANTIPVTSATTHDLPVAGPTVSDWLMMQQRVSELSRALQDSQLSIAVLTDQLDTMLLNQSTTSVKIAQWKESPVNITSGATQNVVAVVTVAETPEP